MKETVIFAPGAGGAELLRSLAGSGRNTLGFRIVGSVELARIALVRSGIAITDTFLPRKDEPSVIDSFLKEISEMVTLKTPRLVLEWSTLRQGDFPKHRRV